MPRIQVRSESAFWLLLCAAGCVLGADAAEESPFVESGRLPLRVHVFEDFETDIEKRWWLRGKLVTENVPESLSSSVPNTRAMEATETKDFDDLMGDESKSYKAVIFNPVPGPPMGERTRLSFRYRLSGTDSLRVQIYSLSKGYHRRLVLKGLVRDKWRSATVDMRQLRRPDGSGGPLGKDERIDDIQFYIDPDARLWIDDIVLYEGSAEGEQRAFPRRAIFTGWFDTGDQGKEWPGDFRIVAHQKPRTWDAAQSIFDNKSGQSWLRIHMRGNRKLSEVTRLRFLYKLDKRSGIDIELGQETGGSVWRTTLADTAVGNWQEADLVFRLDRNVAADEIRFRVESDATLLVDDLLLYEPAKAE